MAKKEAPISALEAYLPPDTYEPVVHYLQHYQVHLTVARERKSILGDYRHRLPGQNHRISVNGNLNPYSFLITLLHELAHLLTFEKHGNRVQSHGREWKTFFGQLLAQFIQHDVFPDDIKQALLRSLANPAASSCADEVLLRVLKQYDGKKEGHLFVESIPEGSLFQTHDGRVFRKGPKLRKRFRCEEVATRRMYLFSPVYEAQMVEE
ncbi:SprT-like domain-containing protein [Paraflavisolibacter sp. H34]|uniref:SprT-like domain-containing protein n=1 Tax=Huijunlia imazamoxiresistens TaxID=3127457 RepID=UPI0030184CCC